MIVSEIYNNTVKCFGAESRCWLITEAVRTGVIGSFLVEKQDNGEPEKTCPQLLNSAVLQPGLWTSSTALQSSRSSCLVSNILFLLVTETQSECFPSSPPEKVLFSLLGQSGCE